MKKPICFSILLVLFFFFFSQISLSQNYKVSDIVGKWEKDGKTLMVFNANKTFVNSWKDNISGNLTEIKGTFKILKGVSIEMTRADKKPYFLYHIKSISEDKKTLTMRIGTSTETWTRK